MTLERKPLNGQESKKRLNKFEQTQKIAYGIFERNGKKDGNDWRDWFAAENILKQRNQSRKKKQTDTADEYNKSGKLLGTDLFFKISLPEVLDEADKRIQNLNDTLITIQKATDEAKKIAEDNAKKQEVTQEEKPQEVSAQDSIGLSNAEQEASYNAGIWRGKNQSAESPVADSQTPIKEGQSIKETTEEEIKLAAYLDWSGDGKPQGNDGKSYYYAAQNRLRKLMNAAPAEDKQEEKSVAVKEIKPIEDAKQQPEIKIAPAEQTPAKLAAASETKPEEAKKKTETKETEATQSTPTEREQKIIDEANKVIKEANDRAEAARKDAEAAKKEVEATKSEAKKAKENGEKAGKEKLLHEIEEKKNKNVFRRFGNFIKRHKKVIIAGAAVVLATWATMQYFGYFLPFRIP